MRSDFNHVYTEKGCSSRGSRGFSKKGLRKEQEAWENDGEGFSKRENNKLRRGNAHSNCKRYSVLCKYIASQVGRKWDAVYSDICHGIQDYNISSYLNYVVEKNVVMRNGLPYTTIVGRYRDGNDKVFAKFYVNPETGILERTPQYPQVKLPKKERTFYPGEATNELYIKNNKTGIWFICKLKTIPKSRQPYMNPYRPHSVWMYRDVYNKVYDVFLKRELIAGNNYGVYGKNRKDFYCYEKKQLNSKELKALKKKMAS